MASPRYLMKWLVVATLWILGSLLLREIWALQKRLSDPTGSYIEFTLMFIATFYPLALIPIISFVDKIFGNFKPVSFPALES